MAGRPSIKKQALDLSERLLSADQFRLLTPEERAICFGHITFPELTQDHLAKKLELPVTSIRAFFHSEMWKTINRELAIVKLRELTQLAVKTLRDCMGPDAKWDVRLKAAISVLTNEDVMQPTSAPRTLHDNKMVVVWNTENNKEIAKISSVEDIPDTQDDGTEDTIHATSKAEGNTRIADPV